MLEADLKPCFAMFWSQFGLVICKFGIELLGLFRSSLEHMFGKFVIRFCTPSRFHNWSENKQICQNTFWAYFLWSESSLSISWEPFRAPDARLESVQESRNMISLCKTAFFTNVFFQYFEAIPSVDPKLGPKMDSKQIQNLTKILPTLHSLLNKVLQLFGSQFRDPF